MKCFTVFLEYLGLPEHTSIQGHQDHVDIRHKSPGSDEAVRTETRTFVPWWKDLFSTPAEGHLTAHNSVVNMESDCMGGFISCCKKIIQLFGLWFSFTVNGTKVFED